MCSTEWIDTMGHLHKYTLFTNWNFIADSGTWIKLYQISMNVLHFGPLSTHASLWPSSINEYLDTRNCTRCKPHYLLPAVLWSVTQHFSSANARNIHIEFEYSNRLQTNQPVLEFQIFPSVNVARTSRHTNNRTMRVLDFYTGFSRLILQTL